nr:CRISPR-associated endonuclease Cas2 [Candidatus Sigynarchaeota archaeon]
MFDYYLVAYDIADPRRLNKLAKFLEGYLRRLQKSVFQGELTASQITKVRDGIKEIINKNEDSVIIYPLSKQNLAAVENFGVENWIDDFTIG